MEIFAKCTASISPKSFLDKDDAMSVRKMLTGAIVCLRLLFSVPGMTGGFLVCFAGILLGSGNMYVGIIMSVLTTTFLLGAGVAAQHERTYGRRRKKRLRKV